MKKWNYRCVKLKQFTDAYGIAEVYYNKKGRIEG